MSEPGASNLSRAFPDTPPPVARDRAELHPPVGPLPPAAWERYRGLILGAGALSLLATAGLAYWRWRRTSPAPRVVPHERERAALELLARQTEDAEVRRQAAPHFRRWIQMRLGLGNAAWTTEQLAGRLASVPGLAEETRATALGLLRESDARVFGAARQEQSAPLVPRMLEWIGRVETEGRPEPSPPLCSRHADGKAG